MFTLIAILSCLALPLLIGIIKDHRRSKKLTSSKHRHWMRCAICGAHQHTTHDYCYNHDLPVYLLFVSERQQRRIDHHISYLWTHPHIKRHQDVFIAFTMRLEDLTETNWSTEAAITVYEQVEYAQLLKFSKFLLSMEEATGSRIDIHHVVQQFTMAGRMEDDQAKVAQN